MSAITVGGRVLGSCTLRPRLAMVPWSASSRRIRFSSMRSAFFSPNSRAISRVPIALGFVRIKATMASRLGKTLSRCFATSVRWPYPLALPALFLATGFVVLAAEVFAVAVTGARALLAASDFGFAAAFFAAGFLAGFAAFASVSALAGFAAAFFAGLAPRFGLPPPLATRSSIKAIASGSVMVSWVLSEGMVALT